MEWEKSESWSDRFHNLTFVCFRKCGRHAGWLSASCCCAGVFFPIIFVSVAVARSVAFAGFGALGILGLGLVLLTDFLFHNITRCEKFCTLQERKKIDDEDDLPRSIRGSPCWMVSIFFFFFFKRERERTLNITPYLIRHPRFVKVNTDVQATEPQLMYTVRRL